MEKKISTGVILFAWLYLLSGLGCIAGIIVLKSKLAAYPGLYPSSYYYVAQFHNVIGSILYLVAGIGLLKLLKWARMFTIVINILFSIFSSITFFIYTRPYLIPYFMRLNRNKSALLTNIGQIMVYAWLLLVIYYFTRPKVKEQFK